MTTSARTGFALLAALTSVTLAVAQGGDGPDDAVLIRELPFTDTGTTVGFTDDSDAVCPYAGSTSPDVYYELLPAPPPGKVVEPDDSTSNVLRSACPHDGPRPTSFSIDLCHSGYDTKTYVLDENLEVVHTSNGAPACNDDFCTSPNGGAFRSFLECLEWDGRAWGEDGRRFIVVDGKDGDAGPYALTIEPQDACRTISVCVIDCPSGASTEPDDCAIDTPDANDQVNGGCNADPPAFTDLACGETVCGTVWMDCAASRRDTDWYRIDADVFGDTVVLDITFQSEFTAVVGRVTGPESGCADEPALVEWQSVAGCYALLELETAPLDPGVHYVFVAPFDLVDCHQPLGGPPAEVGENYALRVECVSSAPPCPWDLDGDNVVGFQDLLKLISNWGPCPP